MSQKKDKPRKRLLSGRYDRSFTEVHCPVCRQARIICLPEESLPTCEICKREMIIKEILTEGKY